MIVSLGQFFYDTIHHLLDFEGLLHLDLGAHEIVKGSGL